ncbi:reverse transcriptase domain-containing protein [Tanacetum coccineum]
MSEEDKEKKTFYSDRGTISYTKMPFGLKNVGATYKRLVNSAFRAQLGRNLEAYVDDMFMKSKIEQEMIMDIEGKFLGYMVTSEGIRANPKKTKAVADMQSPKTLKEMQKNKYDYRCKKDVERVFQEMKKLILELPTLTTLLLKEILPRVNRSIRVEYTYAIWLNFPSTNNETEHEALLAGLRIAQKMKVQALKVKVDSKLVACQLNGEFVASNERMTKYLTKAKEHVDAQEVNAIIEEEEDNWMSLIIKCLEEGI